MISTTSPTWHRLHTVVTSMEAPETPRFASVSSLSIGEKRPFCSTLLSKHLLILSEHLTSYSERTLTCSHNSALAANKTCTEGGSANPLTLLMACFANLQSTLSFPGTTTWHIRSVPSLDSVETKRLFQKTLSRFCLGLSVASSMISPPCSVSSHANFCL